MNSRTSRDNLPPDLSDAQSIDEIYGLEPVFEPGLNGGEPARLINVQCPFCGEWVDTVIDLSAGSFRYIEDCQVCCQPMELVGDVDERYELVSLMVERT